MNIYVGNLSPEVTEDDLRVVFEAYGQVESVNLVKDRFSGESRGFGFVQMPSREEAQSALEGANEHDLKGRAIRVSEAHNRSGGPGGGGGRGGGGRGGGGRGGGGRGGRRY